MNNTNKKYKKPTQEKTQSTTNPDITKPRIKLDSNKESQDIICPSPLAAKDSEWVDILQTSATDSEKSMDVVNDEQEVDCEDNPQQKPLAIMFPGLLQQDPVTLQGMLNKAMSTTEVTRHLVELGQKANFTFMKTAGRLIPKEKQWLERLTESSNSFASMTSSVYNSSFSSGYDADNEITVWNNIGKIELKSIRDGDQPNDQKTYSDDVFSSIKQIITEIMQRCQRTVSWYTMY